MRREDERNGEREKQKKKDVTTTAELANKLGPIFGEGSATPRDD